METNNGLKFKEFFSRITNTEGFGKHIDHSIPGYSSWRARSAYAAAKIKETPLVLDIGASEGQWGAAIQSINPLAIIVDVDPNPDMIKNNVNPNSIKVQKAWVEGFYDAGVYIPKFESDFKFTVINMSMVRQFVTNDADTWYGEVAKYLSDDGVFMLGVKVIASQGKEKEWQEKEDCKDLYKLQFFSPEQINAKAESVLVGMHELMLPIEKEMEALSNHFDHVSVVWHSYNFVGFFASNDLDTLNKAVKLYDTTE